MASVSSSASAAADLVARKTLEIDDRPEETTPPFYLKAIQAHLALHPQDTNFIVEFAKPGRHGTGGNGYGTATCMENYCWKDIVLGPDPDRPNGGKADGFGSLWEYQSHCGEPDHIKGRAERAKPPRPAGQPSSRNFIASQASDTHIRPPANTGLAHSQSSSLLSGSSAVPRHHSGTASQQGSQRASDIARASAMGQLASSSTPAAASTSSVSRSASTTLRPAPSNSPLLDSGLNHQRHEAARAKLPPSTSRYTTQPGRAGPSSGLGAPGGSATRDVAAWASNILHEIDGNVDRKPQLTGNMGESQSKSTLSRSLTTPDPAVGMSSAGPSYIPSSDSEDEVRALGANDIPVHLRKKPNNAAAPIVLRDNSPVPPPPPRTPMQPRSTSANPQFAPAAPVAPRIAPSQSRSTPSSSVVPPAPMTNLAGKLDTLRKEYAFWQKAYKARIVGLGKLPPTTSMVTENRIMIAISKRLRQLEVWSKTISRTSYPDVLPSLKVHYPDAYMFAAAQSLYDLPTARSTVPGVYPPSTRVDPTDPASGIISRSNPDHELYEEPMAPEHVEQYFRQELDDFAEDADIEAGLAKLGLQSLQDQFAEMTVPLMPHQVLGVGWMLEKEKDDQFKGGLLCDAMGLGKTVQTIATIVGNMSEDRKCKTTLIVAPLALLNQWKAEIESKTTEGLLKVLIHHGCKRSKSVNTLKQADVVLTTYGTIVSEFGKDPKEVKRPKPDDDADSFEEDANEDLSVRRKGPLHKVNWYRVVLDEAHIIRNRKTRAAQAIWELEAELRWSLTGTLINNSLDDIFPHFRFLMISPCRNLDEYRKHIGSVQKHRPKLAARRAQAILRTCMLRRHKESELNGRKLLELPPKTEEVVEVDFTEDERMIYDSVETRMRIKFNHFLRQGTVMKHYSCILVWLMRLRQLTCHPWLLRRNPGDIAHPDDWEITDAELFGDNVSAFEAARDAQSAIDCLGEAWVAEVSAKLKQRHLLLQKGDDEATKEQECPICFEPMEQEAISQCKHSFCKTCIAEIFKSPARDIDLTDDQVTRGCRKCPMCRTVMEKNRFFLALAFFDPEMEKETKPKTEIQAESGAAADPASGMSEKRAGKRRATQEIDEKPKVKRAHLAGRPAMGSFSAGSSPSDQEPNTLDQVLPSTKMKYLAERLQDYLAEDGAKIIVFSQFVSYLDLVGIYLSRLGIGHRYYVGSMSHDERNDVVKEFSAPIKDASSPRVMLISLKCGGVGLNLTVASKVIMLDLSWSPAPENQAIDRAHRIGQTKPVDVRRVVIRNTVEQRMLDLQQRKMALADGAMGEGGGIDRLGRLSVRDLMRLFGSNGDE